MFPRFLLTLMTLMRSSCPRNASQVAHRTHVDLRAREERPHADVDCQTTLDPFDDAAEDDLPVGVGSLDLVPDLHLLGLLAREHDVAVAVLGPFQQHVHHVARLDRDMALLVENSVTAMRPSDL